MKLTDIFQGKFPVLSAGLHQLLLGRCRGGGPPFIRHIDLSKLFSAKQKILQFSHKSISFDRPQFDSRSQEPGGIPPESACPGLPRDGLVVQPGSVTDSIAVTEMSKLPVYCYQILMV